MYGIPNSTDAPDIRSLFFSFLFFYQRIFVSVNRTASELSRSCKSLLASVFACGALAEKMQQAAKRVTAERGLLVSVYYGKPATDQGRSR